MGPHFECVKHQGYELCWHPDEYCYTDKNHSECRQCTKDICQRMNTEDFPLQCWPKCAAGVIENHAHVWFGLFLAVLGLGIVILVICLIRKQTSKQRRVEEETWRDPESPENLPLIFERQGVDKETQTESQQKDTKECQAEIPNINDTTYCKQNLQGRCRTNQDKNRVIQPSASFTQNGVLPNRRKTSSTSMVGNDEQNHDQSRSNLTQVSTLNREQDSVLNSTPFNLAPSLGPSTFDHDEL